jgi:hypothetical protein
LSIVSTLLTSRQQGSVPDVVVIVALERLVEVLVEVEVLTKVVLE